MKKEADNDSQEYFYTMVETPLVCWFRFLSPQVGSGTALRNTFKFFHEYHMPRSRYEKPTIFFLARPILLAVLSCQLLAGTIVPALITQDYGDYGG